MTRPGAGAWVVYRWIVESRAKPHRYARHRTTTRDAARRHRDMLNQGAPTTYVVRRLEPLVWAPAGESASIEPREEKT
jgi:hypothetical protein